MRAIYRASFELSGTRTAVQLADEIARDCFNWALDPKRNGLGNSHTVPTRAETVERRVIGNGYEIEALNVSVDSSVAWGMRFSNLDEDPQVRWITEVSVYSPEAKRCQFSCSVFLARSGDDYAPIRRHTSRPRIVRDVLMKFSGKGGFPLHATPVGFNAGNAELFAEFLQSPHRTHPILFLSPADEGHSSPLDAKKIADFLAGVAHVIVTDDRDATWRLEELIPHQLNCYAGAARLYWPGFQVSDSQFNHPLWLFAQIDAMGSHATGRFGQTILNRVSNVAVFNLHDHFLTWDRLQEVTRRRAIAEARAAGRSEEMLVLFEEDNRLLTAQVTDLKRQLGDLVEEAKRQRNLAESYRLALDERKEDTAKIGLALPARSVTEAIENAKREHSNRITFSLNSKSDKDSPFDPPEEVERAFNWLATTYYDSKTNQKTCPDLDKNLSENINGWHYSGHQKEKTIKANEAWYQCPWADSQNGKIWIREHLKTGSSRRPEETIRIAFTWEEKSKKVVIGFIGQHQENTKS